MGIHKVGGSDEQARWAMQIYRECGNDLDAVLMVEGESGFVLNAYNKNKNGTTDTGLFQLNNQFNGKFIRSKDFKDPYKQITYGCDKWRSVKHKPASKSPWYAYRNIASNPKARVDITNRFDITYR